jgi:predicted GNAT family acetyltransferase
MPPADADSPLVAQPMRVRRFHDPHEFQAHVMPLLLEREAENCVTLGVLSRATTKPAAEPDRRGEVVLICAVEDEGGRPVAVATMNRPFVLLLTRADRAAAEALATFLFEQNVDVPGVQAPSETAARFAHACAARMGQVAEPGVGLGLYETSAVVPPRPAPGTFHAADETEVELDLLARWGDAFVAEAGTEPGDMRQHMRTAIREGRAFVWRDPAPDRPVSMVLWTGQTPHGVRIGMVYTPPEFRGCGYASNAVATLTQRLLDSGRRFCFLFTDLANPTSNKIYQAVGYRHVCDFRKILFRPGQ